MDSAEEGNRGGMRREAMVVAGCEHRDGRGNQRPDGEKMMMR